MGALGNPSTPVLPLPPETTHMNTKKLDTSQPLTLSRSKHSISFHCDPITVAADYAISSWIDDHHEELDSIEAEANKIREEALKSLDGADQIQLAQLVVSLIAAIGGLPEDTPMELPSSPADANSMLKERVSFLEKSIALLRDSEAVQEARDNLVPLTVALTTQGRQRRLQALQRKLGRANAEQQMWRAACVLRCSGDLAQYFDEDRADWPALSGSTAKNKPLIEQRFALLHALDREDMIRVVALAEAHATKAGGLSDEEEGKSGAPSGS